MNPNDPNVSQLELAAEQWRDEAKAATVMTPADQAIQQNEAPFFMRRRQRGCARPGRRCRADRSSPATAW